MTLTIFDWIIAAIFLVFLTYGGVLCKKFVSVVSNLMKKDDNPFKWAHDTLKLWRDDEKGIDF